MHFYSRLFRCDFPCSHDVSGVLVRHKTTVPKIHVARVASAAGGRKLLEAAMSDKAARGQLAPSAAAFKPPADQEKRLSGVSTGYGGAD
jgi:hypothetical protein